MKKIYKFMSMLALTAITAACAEKLPEPDNQEDPIIGEITLDIAEELVFSDEGESHQVEFTATLDWTAASDQEWLTVEPKAGLAGEAAVTLRAAQNTLDESRNATVTLTCGDDTKTINVTQKQAGALILTQSTIPVEAAGGMITITAKANSEVTPTIDDDAKSWITEVPTKALVDYIFDFQIEANESESPRSGKIVFENSDGMKETVTIQQAGIEPEVQFLEISDASSLELFATRVAAGETALEAQLTADIDASSLTWTPVEYYAGTLDGNSQTITGLTQPLFGTLAGTVKNLTLESTINATAADELSWGIFAKVLKVGTLEACTAKGSLTYAPSAALSADSQIGGLIGNNKGGLVTNCTNGATVTMEDNGETHSSQVSIAGVVGRTQKNSVEEGSEIEVPQGMITDCTNNGTVVCNAKLSENLYIGGVLGYQVESAETISGCVNNGLVKVTSSFSTGKVLHLGGVIGLGRGTIEACQNGSEGTVTSEEGSTAGTYICQGGVVGRLNSTSRTYSGLTNAGNINVAASGANDGTLIGGTVGRCDEGASITSCVNTGGTINYSATTTNSDLCIGGIVGKMGKNIQSCTNATAISFTGIAEKPVYLGGIAGHAKGSIIETENNGAISLSEESTVSEGDFIFGGIVGRVDNAEVVSNCVNKADITNACALISDDKYLDLGGIAGWNNNTPIVNCTNSGNINNTADSDGYLFIGGIAGETNAGVSGCENSGEISNSGVCAKALENCVGGIAGVNNGNEYASCVNKGKLTCSSDDTNIRVGGIAGYVTAGAEAMFTECVNEGEISISNGADDKVNHNHITVGGVVGRSASKVTLDECDNHGSVNVEITSSNTIGAVIAGGILGDNTDKNVICTGCENHGCVTINNEQTPKQLSDYLVGGIVAYIREAESGTVIEGCKNNSELYIKANRGVMGGIVANFFDGEMKQCTSTSESVVEYQCSNSYKMHVEIGRAHV